MILKRILTFLFALYGIILFGFLILNAQFLFIEDPSVWVNVVIINLAFMILFFLLGLLLTHNLQSKINNQSKMIDHLKGRLYDSLKDDEEREKLMRDFGKSLK
ncbi:MAG TPA: hypothetical protein VD908_06680 [Cytophagales bacterium]|nr:hypothetical protein [Cytophagales bacterium]